MYARHISPQFGGESYSDDEDDDEADGADDVDGDGDAEGGVHVDGRNYYDDGSDCKDDCDECMFAVVIRTLMSMFLGLLLLLLGSFSRL